MWIPAKAKAKSSSMCNLALYRSAVVPMIEPRRIEKVGDRGAYLMDGLDDSILS